MLPNELLKRQWKHTEKTPTPDFEDERATSFLFVYTYLCTKSSFVTISFVAYQT